MLVVLLTLQHAVALDVDIDTEAFMRGAPGTRVSNTPIAEVLAQSAVVAEGYLLEERHDIWLGPSSSYPMLIWRIQVAEEMLGHVENGVVDLVIADDLPPSLEPGDRVLFLANTKKLYLRSHVQAGMDEFANYPAEEDLLIPTVLGSLYHTFSYEQSDGTIKAGWSSPETQRGADWLPPTKEEAHALSWQELLIRMRAEAAGCASCGNTIPGADIQVGP